MTKTFIIAATLAAATLAAAATPALARNAADLTDPAIEPTHIAVAFADLDLASAKGQAALHRRIAHAAIAACTDAGNGLSTPRATHEIDTCRAHATLGAETELAARGLNLHLAMH